MTLRKFHKLKTFFTLFFVNTFVVLIFFAVFVGFFELKYQNKFFANIQINQSSVAGKTYQEVLQEYKTKHTNLEKNGLTLIFKKENQETKVNIPIKSSGLTPDTVVEYFSIEDPEPSILKAYNFGRTGNFKQKIKDQLSLVFVKNFNSKIDLYNDAVKSLLTRETNKFLKPEVDASFGFDKENNLIIVPEKLGDSIDLQKVVDTINENANLSSNSPIIFNIAPTKPNITQKKLEPFLNFAQTILKSTNINFYYQTHHWKVNSKTLITWLTLNSNNQVTVDNKKLETFLAASVFPYIDSPVINSRFKMENGTLVEISKGKAGNFVNTEKIIKQIEDNFLNSFDINIETIQIEPKITQSTIYQYKIRDLVGTATTNFTGGSKDRQKNIEVGTEKLSGILIAPGQEFSTIENIGEVTEEAGFVKEYVIKQGQTIKELGGGLCQVATTLFRAAVNAGLPITERVNHAYVIPYYGPGLDATIYGPHPDFRFVNDTGNYLLLQGKAINNEVTFEFYGVNDKRVVELSKPKLYDEKPVPKDRYFTSNELKPGETKCTTTTHKGITADVTYNVTYPDGTIKTKLFHSIYQPWPKVCLVGPAQ